MKKQDKKGLLFIIGYIIIISILLTASFFKNGMFEGYDCLFHMNRLQGIVNSWQDGQLIPRVYPYTNNGYGYASPLFYCDVFLYPFAFMYWVGIPLVISYKCMLVFYSILSVVSVFAVSSRLFNKKEAPYISTFLYSLCSYHLFDLYIRHAVGELLAFAVYPLAILAIYEVIFEKQNSWKLLGISYALLLLTHLLSFVLYCVLLGVAIVYESVRRIIKKQKIKNLFRTILYAVVFALLLSSFHIFPMLEQLTDQNYFINYFSVFYNIENSSYALSFLFYPFAWMPKLQEFGTNKIPIGLVYSAGLIICFCFFRNREKSPAEKCAFWICFVCIFLSLGILPISKYFKEVNVLQFYSRLFLIEVPVATFLLTYCFSGLDKKYLIIIMSVVCLYFVTNNALIQYWQSIPELYGSTHNIDNNKTHEELYDFSELIGKQDYNKKEVAGAEYLPVTNYTDYLTEIKKVKTTDGNEFDVIWDEVSLNYSRIGTKVSLTYYSEDTVTLMLPLTYYKGYKIVAYSKDGSSIPVNLHFIEKYRQVAFDTLPGEYTYICHYEGTLAQYITVVITLLTVAIYIFYEFKKIYQKN